MKQKKTIYRLICKTSKILLKIFGIYSYCLLCKYCQKPMKVLKKETIHGKQHNLDIECPKCGRYIKDYMKVTVMHEGGENVPRRKERGRIL